VPSRFERNIELIGSTTIVFVMLGMMAVGWWLVWRTGNRGAH
jgi:hypothetical protein